MPSTTTTHVHCFINIKFHVLFFFPLKSFDSRSFFFSFLFFFFSQILVADLSSSSSYSDRIRPNWGCFSQILDQLGGISVDFGLNWCQIGPNRWRKKEKEKKWRIGALKWVECRCGYPRAALVLPKLSVSNGIMMWQIF